MWSRGKTNVWSHTGLTVFLITFDSTAWSLSFILAYGSLLPPRSAALSPRPALSVTTTVAMV